MQWRQPFTARAWRVPARVGEWGALDAEDVLSIGRLPGCVCVLGICKVYATGHGTAVAVPTLVDELGLLDVQGVQWQESL